MKAYENLDFLHSADARIIRVLSEFLEPEQRLREFRIQDTIVFFGSARAIPQQEARKHLEALKLETEKKGVGKSPEAQQQLEDAENAVRLGRYYDDAVELAGLMTQWSMNLPHKSRRFIICSGGGPGIMEAANRGAHNAGGLSMGFNISLDGIEPPNEHISQDLNFLFHYFFIRKYWFTYLAKALIIFPGGFGTLDELMEVLTLIQTGKIKKQIPVVIFGKDYWNEVIDFDALVRWGTISRKDLELFRLCDTPQEAFEFLTKELESLYLKPTSVDDAMP